MIERRSAEKYISRIHRPLREVRRSRIEEGRSPELTHVRTMRNRAVRNEIQNRKHRNPDCYACNPARFPTWLTEFAVDHGSQSQRCNHEDDWLGQAQSDRAPKDEQSPATTAFRS